MMNLDKLQTCIDTCYSCAQSCDRCAGACLQEDDVKMMANCIALDIDCAAICRLTAGFMARSSTQSDALCPVCAQVCEACADECGQHPAQHCQDCAAMCRRCAQACREMGAGGTQVPNEHADQA
jgi:hypothetical protein